MLYQLNVFGLHCEAKPDEISCTGHTSVIEAIKLANELNQLKLRAAHACRHSEVNLSFRRCLEDTWGRFFALFNRSETGRLQVVIKTALSEGLKTVSCYLENY